MTSSTGTPAEEAEDAAIPPIKQKSRVSSTSSSSISRQALPTHHVPGSGLFGPKFQNPWDTWEQRSFMQAFQWQRQRSRAGIPLAGHLIGNRKPSAQDWSRAFPLHKVDMQALRNPPADAIQALWVGHATVLVQMCGVTFITDPVFSERCAPAQWLGPRRLVAPALDFSEVDLPPLDFVVVSHNHYDHLDTNSVRTLNKRYGKALTWYVPLGLGSWFRSEGVAGRVVEMDWWQCVEHRAPHGACVEVTMVPAQHWTLRLGTTRNRSLWGGYVVSGTAPAAGGAASARQPAAGATAAGTPASGSPRTPADGTLHQQQQQQASSALLQPPQPLRFYFAGDSGYCPVFKEIGERLGGVDLAALPIGAYEPRWFLQPQHTDAAEALQCALDVCARRALAIHHATWSLTDEPMDEPAAKLAEELVARKLAPNYFLAPQHGCVMAVRSGGELLRSPQGLLPVGSAAAAEGGLASKPVELAE